MLASTGARTRGLCMACKQRIRKNIEVSKIYYQQQRQSDPFRDFWTVLVRRVRDAPDGFYRLSPQEKTYFAVCALEREVYNGGMHQFFWNSSGAYYAEALHGLQELGAMRSHALLVAACREFFPDREPPCDTAARREILPEQWHYLYVIEREFCSDPDKLGDRLHRYALDHQLVLPRA